MPRIVQTNSALKSKKGHKMIEQQQRPTRAQIECAAAKVKQYREIFKANGVTADEADQVLIEEDLDTYYRCIQILRANQIAKKIKGSR